MSKHYMAQYDSGNFTFTAFGGTELLAREYLEHVVFAHIRETWTDLRDEEIWQDVREYFKVREDCNVIEFDTDKPVGFRDWLELDAKTW